MDRITAPCAQLASLEAGDPLCGALLESRQRWRDLVTLAADLAFETDASGRFTFITPDPALGWAGGMLLRQPAELLLADGGTGFNPFRPSAAFRRRRAWLKRADGGAACLAFASAPLVDDRGRIVGARGIALDVTEQEGREGQVAAALRYSEVIDHILCRMREEVLAPRMMAGVLDALVKALGAEGAAVIDTVGEGAGPAVLHHAGGDPSVVLGSLFAMLKANPDSPVHGYATDATPVLVCPCQSQSAAGTGLGLWRNPGSRGWDAEDRILASSAASIILVVLEHEAIQREMAKQARTDPLTGLLNRRAFLDEMARQIERLDREGLPGTLMFADLDNFKPLNDHFGHEAGDEALRRVAKLLRDIVRPTDLVARFGGDEFAVWLNGADHLTTAERAEMLRVQTPLLLESLTGGNGPSLSMSIGIAPRIAGGGEAIDALMRRADQAMYEVKRHGRGHWRVAHGSEE